MYRDEEDDTELRGSLGDDRSDYKSPIGSKSVGRDRSVRPPVQPQARLRTSGSRRAQAAGWTPANEPRRGPTHPDWEKPPTQYDFPHLRGQEDHRALWPLAAAALGVALVVVVLVIIPAILSGHGTVASATGSAQPTAVHSGDVIGSSEPPSLDPDTSQPQMTFATHYTVKKGDRFAAIAKKYHLQQWELLAANPQVTNPAVLKVGTILNIPDPGQMAKPTATPKPTGTAKPSASASPAS